MEVLEIDIQGSVKELHCGSDKVVQRDKLRLSATLSSSFTITRPVRDDWPSYPRPRMMALPFPYARYGCPCSDHAGAPAPSTATKRISKHVATGESSDIHNDNEGDDETFNPHEPRAAYSLFPLEQLLYCDECNATRCPRCCSEEMMCWYCPNCMFEVPSSGVKGDGNR